MITTAILYLIYGFILVIVSPLFLFDDVVANSDVTSALNTIISWLGFIKSALPLTIIFSALTTVLVLEIFVGSYKVIMWTIRRFWGS